MRKPMLGILGVSLMQVAFLVYNAIDLPVDFSTVSAVRETAQVPAQLNLSGDSISTLRGRAPNKYRAGVAPPTSAPAVVAAKQIVRHAAKPHAVRPQMSAIHKSPIRTEYPVAPLEYSESTKAFTASIRIRTTRKKSFFSKSVRIIKKPYDWAKTFAGKLN